MAASTTRHPARPLMVGGIVFLVAAALSGLLVLKLEQHSLQDERVRVARLAADHADLIEYTIAHALSATQSLATLVRQGNGSIANFDVIAHTMLPYYPGASELALAPGGVIRNVAPMPGNKMAIGLNLLTVSTQRKESLLARDSGKLTLAGPLELAQGGTGVIGRLPVFLKDRGGHPFFWGFTLVVMRLPGGLDMAHLSHLDEQGLAYALWRIQPDTGQKQLIARSSPATLIEPVERTLHVPNATWTLSVAPVKGWGHPFGLSLKVALGLLFSLMLGYLAKLFVTLKMHKQLLETRVAHRTAEILVAQRKLQATLDAIPDLVWLKDADGAYLSCNPMFERFFGAREAEIVGKTDYDFVERAQADLFRAHDRMAMAAGKPSINEEWITFADDGSRKRVETIKTPMVDEEGKPIGVLGIARDITARVQAEHALQGSRQRAQQYLNIVGVMLIAVDAAGRIQLINRKGCEILGASEADILGKNWFEHFLPERIRNEVKEMFSQTLNGSVAPIEYMENSILTLSGDERVMAWHNTLLLDDAGGVTGMLASGEDITERKHYIAELEHKALYDSLTDLPNRNLFTDRLTLALAVARRETRPLAIILLDIARLKEVNDILGHHNGDIVIKEVARRITTALRETDTVARLSGDEFAILLPGDDKAAATFAIEKIQKAMESPAVIDGSPLDIEVNMGVTVYPQHGEDPGVLISRADIAMRMAKTEVSGFCVYESGSDPYTRRRLSLLGELRQAISQNELVLYYQPQIDIASGKIMGVEALVRWPRTVDDMVSPMEFIPIAEQSGLIRPLTLWVLEQAVRQCGRWRAAGFDLKVSANLSARNLLDPTLPAVLATMLASLQVTADCLMLEVTESAVMLQPERALHILTQLHEMGTSLSVDDFGTGYSSLAYLKKLPVRELKIDQSFVSGMVRNENDAIIVRSTIDLANNLGLKVVAEGVEDQETLQLLASLGCDTGQGFLFARPMPPEDFSRWLSESPWGFPIGVQEEP
ncbi:EAL domain-containing protein [Thiobacillus sp.]|uniref:bifunctional diguanylate cyclase/phosphodiesterase n=1 Tax=Thiobacillus sp. TaxID=924 RepID=UPI00286E3DFC|nr:EAL domain-containing protein [Thiobacillus sp.]